MKEELNQLIDVIASDYDRSFGDRPGAVEDFTSGLSVSEGRKYIKIISRGSVWGFIVKKDDGKFRAGDILKAASWATPARNQARGNILEGDFGWVRWTGPAYL